MSAQFFDALGLLPASRLHYVEKTRPLTLQINLKPQSAQEYAPRTPKTPCSMLSPLTPKAKKLDWQNSPCLAFNSQAPSPDSEFALDYENDPSLALMMMIDITSNLGKRLSSNFSALINSTAGNSTSDYERYCNKGQQPRATDMRKLRSLEGRNIAVYRKRICHRYIDRMYIFKTSDKKERKRTLLAGGLNKRSRDLLRRMKRCSVASEKMDVSHLPFKSHQSINVLLKFLRNPANPVVMVARLNLQQLQHYQNLELEGTLESKPSKKLANPTKKVVVTPTNNIERYDGQRISVRQRSKPRRLLHVI